MKVNVSMLLLIFMSFCFSSCQAIGDIFKTGVWFGVIGVIALILLIVFLVTRSKNN